MNFLKKQEELGVVRIRISDDETSFSYTKVDRTGEVLEVSQDSLCTTNSIDELKSLVGGRPVILIFIGPKILYSENEELFISSKDSFYSTYYENKKGKIFLALIRKNLVDSLLEVFYEENFFIVDLSVGVLGFNLLYQGVSSEEIIDSVSFRYENKDCFQVLSNFQNYDSSSSLTKEDETLILSSIFNLFYPMSNIINGYDNDILKNNREELEHKINLTQYSKIGVLCLFLIVCVGYFSGEYFAIKNREVNSFLNSGFNKQKMLRKLGKEEVKKMKMFELSGFLKSNSTTFYINELMKILPNGVLLKTLKVFPLKHELNEMKRVIVNDKLIVIEGSFEEINDFNLWVSKFKEVLNIEKVNTTITKKERVVTYFELQVLLK